jgi:hypothetical protein
MHNTQRTVRGLSVDPNSTTGHFFCRTTERSTILQGRLQRSGSPHLERGDPEAAMSASGEKLTSRRPSDFVRFVPIADIDRRGPSSFREVLVSAVSNS